MMWAATSCSTYKGGLFMISEALGMPGVCHKYWLFNIPKQWKLTNKNHTWKIRTDGWNGDLYSLSNFNSKLNWGHQSQGRNPWPQSNYFLTSCSLIWRCFYSRNCWKCTLHENEAISGNICFVCFYSSLPGTFLLLVRCAFCMPVTLPTQHSHHCNYTS